MVTTNRSKLSWLEIGFILLFSFLAINPKMNAMIPMQLYLLIEFAYSLYVIFIDKYCRSIVRYLFICAFIISFLFTFITSIDYIGSNASNREIKSLISMTKSFYSLSFPVLFLIRLLKKGSHIQQSIVLIFNLVVLFVILRVTISELAINEYLMKSQMEVDLESGENALVGGYYFVCAGPIIATCLFYAFLNCKQIIMKWLLLALSLFSVYFLVKSQYSIALLSGLFGMSMALYMKSNSKYKFLYVVAPFIIYHIAPPLLSLGINVLDEGDTKLRMYEIYNLLVTGDMGDGDMAVRFSIYKKSLLCFFSSPIWGVYDIGFNAHSTLLNIMASLGLLGTIPFCKLINKSFAIVGELTSEWSVTPCLCAFWFMCLTNPINNSMPLNMSLWLIAPLLYSTIGYINTKDIIVKSGH